MRVTLLEQTSDVVTITADVLENLISKLGVSAVVNLTQAHNDDLGGPVFELEGEDSGLLIGRRGETLRAMQFLLKFIVSQRLEARASLMLDVEGYQMRRYRALTNLARSVAERVVATGRPVTLEPMPPDERRVVHMAIAEHPRVTTESVGMGDGRQVVVALEEE